MNLKTLQRRISQSALPGLACVLTLAISVQGCGAGNSVDGSRHEADTTNAATMSARLYNFDSKDRVAGRYIVVFKDAQKLAHIQAAGSAPPEVLPDVLPDTRANLEALASALAKRVNGALGTIYDAPPGVRGFGLSDVSEDDVRNVLAQDPRVESIEAELNFKPL